MRHLTFFILSLLIVALSQIRLARAEPQFLEPIIVSARGYQQLQADVAGGANVVTEDEIRLKAPFSLGNVLGRVPGVSKSSDGTWGSDINIRGLGRSSVVFLIDGARVNTATDISAQYGLVEPQDIERMEILKGPISALYGSGSVGGVVNLITRDADYSLKPELDAYLSTRLFANPDGGRLYTHTSYGEENLKAFVSQSFRNHRSYEDGAGKLVRQSQFKDYQTSLKVGLRSSENQETKLQLQYFEAREVGIPGTGLAPLPLAADVTYPAARRGLVQLSHEVLPEELALRRSKVALYYQYIDRRVRTDNFPEASAVLEVHPSADHDTLGANWINELEIDQHLVVFGFDIWQRELESTRSREFKNGTTLQDLPLPRSRFLSAGVYAEDSFPVTEGLEVNVGGRGDFIRVSNDATPQFEAERESDFSWNSHLGLRAIASETLQFTALAGQGYRAASIEERYAFLQLSGGQVKLGDPELDPERSSFFELGSTLELEQFALTASAYANFIDDLISERRVSDDMIVNANVSEARLTGYELDASWNPSSFLELFLVLSFVKGRDTTANEDLPFIPPVTWVVGSNFEGPDGWSSRLELTATAPQEDVPVGTETTPGYETVSAYLSYDFLVEGRKSRVTLGAENLFDEDYRDHLSTSRNIVLKEPGRSLSFGLELVL